MSIDEFLSVGESEAVSLENLSLSTGLSERAVKKEVLEARIKGKLILSSENGYFLPSTADDIRSYVYKRKAYLKTASKALKPFVNALKA